MTTLSRPGPVSPEDVSIPVDGRRPLRAWHWKADAPAGVLVIAHGLGEHAGLYRELAEQVVPAAGFDVLAVDLTGHGRSPGRRGHVDRYDRLVDDVMAALSWSAWERPGRPRVVLGHSNGGVATLLALLRDRGAADALILSNPALRLKFRPAGHKLAVGHLLRAVAPWVTLSGPLPVEGLTRDPIQQVRLRTDRLMHTRIGPPLFFGMRDAGRALLERAGELDLPLLLLLGADDPIIDPDSGRAFFDRYGGAEKAVLDLPGFRHSLLFDRDRGIVTRAVVDWLGSLPSGGPVRPGAAVPAGAGGEGRG